MYSSQNNRFINPSFSSTLLDKIYRSIDEGERNSSEMKFYRETTATTTVEKQSRSNVKSSNRASEKVDIQGRQHRFSQMHYHRDHDDVMFFSSTSTSSDSSSGRLSLSDTESIYGVRSKASCFVPYSKPKPVRTSVCEKTEKKKKQTERKQSTLFHEQKGMQIFDTYSTYSHDSNIGRSEEGLIKSKSRALKIYNNLKKVKQPISPGGKLTSFLNSLFTTGNNTKKTKSASSVGDLNSERKAQAVSTSTCSSASSFSRSCLSKTSPSTREKLPDNGVKRTVRFYPVSVIVDEDSRPCGHKCLYQEQENEYNRNPKKIDLVSRDFCNEDEQEDDDASSDSSSDLFELDHLTVMGNQSYLEELPVYETTHLRTNRVIANGFLM